MANLLLRSVYAKRAFMNPQMVKLNAIRSLSSVPSSNVNPHGWKSWKDIPDSALPKCPDPTNGIYETDTYKKLQKKRIWYQIPDGTPVYFKEGARDKILVYSYGIGLFAFLAYEYFIIFTEVAQ
ncbi:hypothetical protein RDWZM_008497 [Blomia tropicalis]|uniref:Uncharacterized protein n=1 Tax=Blomia tropicalis TaxID=40697 RepID=A0A9Q0M4K6_BLOTA|nr:hypothetical protein BLOT_011069 [Blomia tropicalis]KAJ6217340.1 hypothetical protein RDWZM_008497 [Blomia tropicalis]